MTIFGLDVSEHQNGLWLKYAKDAGASFAIIRLCDGTYKDPVFHSHLQDAEQQGLVVSTYWYLRAPSEGTTIAQQADTVAEQLGGRKDLGVWVDVESVSGGTKLLTREHVHEAKRELEARGIRYIGVYSGRWYWENMPGGEPSMSDLGYLWKADWGQNAGGGFSDAYPGDGVRAWTYPLGDRAPDLLQYSSNVSIAGFRVDADAYRGSLDELKAMFNGTTGGGGSQCQCPCRCCEGR